MWGLREEPFPASTGCTAACHHQKKKEMGNGSGGRHVEAGTSEHLPVTCTFRRLPAPMCWLFQYGLALQTAAR